MSWYVFRLAQADSALHRFLAGLENLSPLHFAIDRKLKQIFEGGDAQTFCNLPQGRGSFNSEEFVKVSIDDIGDFLR
ncbi:hypothetical protein Y602_3438 [Burkholderia pseudomallei MSHR733]|nr:hypothetical protein Y602_3438 [Burkholderia pseudomallei MSHR733]KGW89629.1 hypothetical protein Y030_4197 [Burkholderia pseudomallei MSHR332]